MSDDVADRSGSGPWYPGPEWLRRWGARAWWTVGIVAIGYLAFRGFGKVKLVALPLVLGLFPAAVLLPAVRWLEAKGWPRAVAALATLGAVVAALGLMIALIGPSLATGLGDIGSDLSEVVDQARRWLIEGPLGLSAEQVDRYWEQTLSGATQNGASTILGGVGTVVEGTAGLLLTIVVAFFLLKDGDRFMDAAAGWLSSDGDGRMREAFRVGRRTLGRYIGGLAVVGLFDAVLIGVGLVIIGVPLALPLSVLIFWGAFFPIVGAYVTGFVAVAVALVNGGFTQAVIVLVLITVVQQVEGDVILPLVFGNALPLHPLVVLIGVIGGGAAFGVAGAFLTVPVLATIVAVRRTLQEPSAA